MKGEYKGRGREEKEGGVGGRGERKSVLVKGWGVGERGGGGRRRGWGRRGRR